MKRQIIIQYQWWNSGNSKSRIKKSHVEALEESATDRIGEQMAQGFTSGELNDNIRMDNDDGEDGVEYRGHWSVEIKEI